SACTRYRRCPQRRESSCSPHGPALDALADLATELTQHFVAVALLNDALDPAIEAVGILLREVLRGYDHDWKFLPIWPSAQFVHELEPVHLRHHQVENDYVGLRRDQRIDRSLAIFRLGHLPPDRLKRLPHAASHDFVVVDQKH